MFAVLAAVQPNASLAERLRAFVWRVVGAVGERTVRPPPGAARVPQAVYDRITAWLHERRQRIEALMARIEAGRFRTSRRRAPRPVTEGTAPKPRAMAPPEDRTPRVFGWICRWAPEAARGGGDLVYLLEDSQMQAMVRAAPGPMMRLWSPLLNALGQRKPHWFPVAPKRHYRRSRRRSAARIDAVPALLTGAAAAPAPPPPPPRPPPPPPAPWLGRGPGPCTDLAQYRSPFEPPGDPPSSPPLPEWQRALFPRTRRT